MPKTHYEALPLLDEDVEETEQSGLPSANSTTLKVGTSASPTSATSRRPSRHHRRSRSAIALNSTFQVDASHLDAKLKQWVNALNKKFAKNRRKQTVDTSKPYEILASAFAPVEPPTSSSATGPLKTLDHKEPITQVEVASAIAEVKTAISQGIQPRLNRAGTSGSYFAKAPNGRIRAIFKPKNEEPYGSLNPKWSKWFHRNLLSPFFGFGRACLVPNFSYLSESGASLLSDRLELYIVPHTALVSLSSPSFFYDWLDRRAYKRNKRTLPEKIGSFQLFLDGYKDASEFLKMYPWPGRAARDTLDLTGNAGGRRRRKGNWTRKCRLLCGTAGVDDDSDDEDEHEESHSCDGSGDSTPTSNVYINGDSFPQLFTWTKELMSDFRLELEKLVVLDVLMRNTDRGLDNFMVKICHGACRTPSSSSLRKDKEAAETSTPMQPRAKQSLFLPLSSSDSRSWNEKSHVHIAAIDNSLSFPIHHPNSWRSYCYGWLFLPSSLIGLPFSKQTRDHFLPLLTSPVWWAKTVFDLRRLFSKDDGFSDKMFKRQISVLKGQAVNIVMSLRDLDAGPLELCRRSPCIVHDDEVVIVDDGTPTFRDGTVNVPYDRDESGFDQRPAIDRMPSSDQARSSTPILSLKPQFHRYSSERPASHCHSSFGPTPMSPPPLSVARHVDLNRATFGNATGVSMMEHMERLQKMGETSVRSSPFEDFMGSDQISKQAAPPLNGHTSFQGAREYRQGASLDLERGNTGSKIGRLRSGSIDGYSVRDADLSLGDTNPSHSKEPATKVVIVERIEEVHARPYFVKW